MSPCFHRPYQSHKDRYGTGFSIFRELSSQSTSSYSAPKPRSTVLMSAPPVDTEIIVALSLSKLLMSSSTVISDPPPVLNLLPVVREQVVLLSWQFRFGLDRRISHQGQLQGIAAPRMCQIQHCLELAPCLGHSH